MKICKHGNDPEAQKDCENYEPKDSEKNLIICFMFRDLGGLYHCNGLNDNTKREKDNEKD